MVLGVPGRQVHCKRQRPHAAGRDAPPRGLKGHRREASVLTETSDRR
jgi:hypothetical protein